MVLHAAIQIVLAVGQPSVRNRKPMAAAVAIQQPAEKILAAKARRTKVILLCELCCVKLFLCDDRIVRVRGGTGDGSLSQPPALS